MTKLPNGDMPASPLTNENGAPHWHGDIRIDSESCSGLTKRELFALKIHCANLIANPHYENMGYTMTSGVSDAVADADALLAELEK